MTDEAGKGTLGMYSPTLSVCLTPSRSHRFLHLSHMAVWVSDCPADLILPSPESWGPHVCRDRRRPLSTLLRLSRWMVLIRNQTLVAFCQMVQTLERREFDE